MLRALLALYGRDRHALTPFGRLASTPLPGHHRLHPRNPLAQAVLDALDSDAGRRAAAGIAGRVFARSLKRTGIAKPWPTFHDLRHGFASAWIASGGDLVELSAHMGRDPAVTARVYSHEFERARRSDARRDRLDAIYGRDVARKSAAERRTRRQATGRMSLI